MNNIIGSYHIQKLNDGSLKIDYKRSPKDIFYSIVYFLISAPILFFSYKLLTILIKEDLDFNLIIGYFFSICILLFGLYFLIVSIESSIKPTTNVFFIDVSKKQLTIKLNLFKKLQLNFSEIKNFNLGAKDITITNHNDSSTYKRQLFLIFLYVQLSNNKIIKIHKFEGTDILISFFENKKNKALIEVSKQIAEIISQECEKKFYWKGTQKEK